MLAGAEAWRLRQHFEHTVDRLVGAQTELRQVLDELPEALIEIDRHGVIRSSNAMAWEMTGRDEERLFATQFVSCVHHLDRDAVLAWLGRGLEQHDTTGTVAPTLEFTIRRADGSEIGVDGVIEQSVHEDRLALRLRDVSEREDRMRALNQARRRFQQAFHSAPTGMALVRLSDGQILDANLSLAEMLDERLDDLVGRNIRELTHPDDLRGATANRVGGENTDAYLLEQRFRRRDGEYVWARTRVAITEDDGVKMAITHIEDVTDQRRTAEALEWAATHDELTGLPNRTMAMATVDRLLENSRPADRWRSSSSTSTTSRW